MPLARTLSAYIARQFLAWFCAVFAAMLLVAFLLNYLDLLRRGVSKAQATLGVLFEMAALKSPQTAQDILPFAILFGTMLAFWRLTRSNELVIARAAGVSVWQFLTPAVLVAFLIGLFSVTLFSPVGSLMETAYQRLESRILHEGSAQLLLSGAGLWLRQSDEAGNQIIIHADKVVSFGVPARPKGSIGARGWAFTPGLRSQRSVGVKPGGRPAGGRHFRLAGVTLFFFNALPQVTSRIDARAAQLESGEWRIENGTRWLPDGPPESFARLLLPTDLTRRNIEESFAAPDTMSFWSLPGFIRLLQRSGFPTQRHRLYFDLLLVRPFLLSALVLVAAAFSLRSERRGGATMMIVGGVATGFLLYFLSDVVFALGLSAKVPVTLAAWTPTGVSLIFGASMLLHLEDG
ncbi:MAG TPA: LptF/LptG family permease [Stellaceae bacterium]|nr:LptF/LptG family permease [Stellaceae bacterium]